MLSHPSSNLMIANLLCDPQACPSFLSVKSDSLYRQVKDQTSCRFLFRTLVTNFVVRPEGLQSPALMFFSVRLVRC